MTFHTKVAAAGQLGLFDAPAPPPRRGIVALPAATPRASTPITDMAAIIGQEVAKRALEIALVGGHPILLAGPSGCGKTLLLNAARVISEAEDWDFGGCEWTRPGDDAPQALDRPLDSFAIHADCQQVSAIDLTLPPPCENSAEIVRRVKAARAIIDATMVEQQLDEPAQRLLDDAAAAMKLTDQQQWTAIEVAESIAALAGEVNRIRRIHIAEALAYARQFALPEPEPTQPPPPAPSPAPVAMTQPAPEPPPVADEDADADPNGMGAFERARIGNKEIVEVDPAWLEYDSGDVREAYCADTLAMEGRTRKPFTLDDRAGQWVNTGGCYMRGKSAHECYRIVPVEQFDGPSHPYKDHDWEWMRGNTEVGSYHGMSARQGEREIVLQGPPIIVVAGQPAQAAML